jgi:hypothetical protein
MHEILLHIIDGPGTGWTFMVLGFFALVAVLASLRWDRKADFQRGKEEARCEGLENIREGLENIREGLENIQVTLVRLVSDVEKDRNRGVFIE